MKFTLKQMFASTVYVVLFIFFLLTLFLFLPAYRNYNKIKNELAELNRELNMKQEKCLRLKQEVHDLEHNPAAIEKVAREKFELSKEGEIILKYEDR